MPNDPLKELEEFLKEKQFIFESMMILSSEKLFNGKETAEWRGQCRSLSMILAKIAEMREVDT